MDLLLVPGTEYVLSVEAKGQPARGIFPLLEVHLGAERLARLPVETTEWDVFTVPFAPVNDSSAVRLRFPNDFHVPGGEDRNLIVGRVSLSLSQARSAAVPPG